MNINKLYSTIDTQVLGETFRIVIQSPISFPEGELHEKQQQLQENFIQEKKLLLNEPRGHRGVNGCIILPSTTASYALLFFNHVGAVGFKYEGIAASLTALLETGNLTPNKENEYSVQTVEGEFLLHVEMDNNQVTSISITLSHIGEIWGNEIDKMVCIDQNRYYTIETLPKHIDSIDIHHLEDISTWGVDRIQEYEQKDVALDGLVVIEEVGNTHFKSVTFEKDGYIRRSPGLDSTIAIALACANELKQDTAIKNETIFNSSLIINQDSIHNQTFKCKVRPFITGSQEFILDVDDPLPTGFLLK